MHEKATVSPDSGLTLSENISTFVISETYVKCILTRSTVLDWAVTFASLAYRAVSTLFLSVGIHSGIFIRHGHVMDNCAKNPFLGGLPRRIQEKVLSGWHAQPIF